MQPLLIGLAGISGAGKSTLADHLEAQGGVTRFRFDAYYKSAQDCPKLADGRPHWDLPESLYLDELCEALRVLKTGDSIFLPVYNRRLCGRTGEVLYKPSPVIFVDGLQLFAHPEVRSLLDLRLWLDIDEETALARRLLRQPDYDVDYHWRVAVPAHRAHVLPLKRYAHGVIDGSGSMAQVTDQADQLIQRFFEMTRMIA